MKVIAVVIAALLATIVPVAQSQELCNCQFNVPAVNETGCRVYGQLGDGVLIPWYRASQDCLDYYDIKDRAVDPDVLYRMCPYNNETDVNFDAFINYLRFQGDDIANGIMLSYPDFWMDDGNGNAVFRDQLQNPKGDVYDCVNAPSFCWNFVKIFFTTYPGEIGQVCADLHSRMVNSLEKEQSFVRIRLCSETDISNDCEPLATQVTEYKLGGGSTATARQSNETFCSSFGLGPISSNSEPLPDEDTCVYDENLVGENGESGAHSALSGVAIGLAAILVLVA